MLITTNILYRDMLIFFRNQFNNIFFLSLLSTIIIITLEKNLMLKYEDLLSYLNDTNGISLQQIIKQLSIDQKYILLKITISNILVNLINNILSIGGLLAILKLASYQKHFNIIQIIYALLPNIQKLTILIFIITILVQIGLMLIIIPGILIMISFCLAPILITEKNLSIIQALHVSTKLAWINFNLISPAIVLWLSTKLSIFLLINRLMPISILYTQILINIIINIINSLLLIYLYRLYTKIY